MIFSVWFVFSSFSSKYCLLYSFLKSSPLFSKTFTATESKKIVTFLYSHVTALDVKIFETVANFVSQKQKSSAPNLACLH